MKSRILIAATAALSVFATQGSLAEASVRFPKKIYCGEDMMLVTHLEAFHSVAEVSKQGDIGPQTLSRAEEKRVNNWWGGYFRLSAQRNLLTAYYYSCDTEDREYTFSLPELAVQASDHARSKHVGARLNVSVRSDEHQEIIDCTAVY